MVEQQKVTVSAADHIPMYIDGVAVSAPVAASPEAPTPEPKLWTTELIILCAWLGTSLVYEGIIFGMMVTGTDGGFAIFMLPTSVLPAFIAQAAFLSVLGKQRTKHALWAGRLQQSDVRRWNLKYSAVTAPTYMLHVLIAGLVIALWIHNAA